MLGFGGVELGHHFPGEQLERFADVLVAGLAGLVEQDHLVDPALPELAELPGGSSRASRSGPIFSAFFSSGPPFQLWYSFQRSDAPGASTPFRP